ncbi:hypothetical protein AAAC51_08940 [Priestia megaterium]
MYTDQHVHYFRAVLTLSKAGESLASIQEMLRSMSDEEVKTSVRSSSLPKQTNSKSRNAPSQ